MANNSIVGIAQARGRRRNAKAIGELKREVLEAFTAYLEAAESATVDWRGELPVDFFEEVRAFETRLIRAALFWSGGNQAEAARLLKLKPTTLHNKIKLYGIEVVAVGTTAERS